MQNYHKKNTLTEFIMIIWKIDHHTITYWPIRNECRLIMRKIITNRQKWSKITMVTRHRVYGPTNLCSPYAFPNLPDRGSWKETFLLGLTDPDGEGDLQLQHNFNFEISCPFQSISTRSSKSWIKVVQFCVLGSKVGINRDGSLTRGEEFRVVPNFEKSPVKFA